MSQTDITLRLVMLLLAGIFSVSWLSVGFGSRVHIKTTLSFFTANFCIAIGVVLFIQRANNPSFISIQTADWLIISGFVFFRHGILYLVRQHPPNLILIVLPLLIEIALTVAAATNPSSYFYRAIVFNVIASFVAIRGGIDCMEGLRKKGFSIFKKLIIGWPFLVFYVLGTAFALRLLQILYDLSHNNAINNELEMHYTVFLWTFTAVLILVNVAVTGVYVGNLLQSISNLSETDSLTNCLNRRGIIKYLNKEMGRIQRNGQPLACTFYDLDYFKSINDTYGHDAGDAVLTHTANLVRAAIRDVDIFGRYGGEEFVILMPNTSLESALAITHRILKLLIENPPNFHGQLIAVTASFGLTCLKPDESDQDLLQRADEAMYEAKRLGRNSIEVAHQNETV